MAQKRKASFSPEDKDGVDGGSGQRQGVGVSTPHRSLPTKSPNKLNFGVASSSVSTNNAAGGGGSQGIAHLVSTDMRKLNEAFVKHCQGAIAKEGDCVLLPLIRDYETHTRELFKGAFNNNNNENGHLTNGTSSVYDFQKLFTDFETEVDNGPLSKKFASTFTPTTNNNHSGSKEGSKVTPSPIINPKPTETISVTGSKPPSLPTPPNPTPATFSFASNSFANQNHQSSKDRKATEVEVIDKKAVNVSNGPPMSKVAEPAKPFFGFSFAPPPPKPAESKPEASSASSTKKAEGEDEDTPPVNEFTKVVEDDSLYSVRCKIFGMIGGGYKDKGVGQLYVKKLESGKHQIVVRADNSLGTILLNVLLKENLPLKKQSAKDVMTVDPTGNGGKPLTVLIRVKSEEMANELLEKLQHFATQSSS